MTLTFRPAVEQLDARELPAVVMKDLLVSSVVAPKPPANDAPVVLQAAPEAGTELRGVKSAGYDLKTASPK